MECRACIPVGPPVADPLPSYWHDPKSPLANIYHGEDDSQEPYDYLIIGSGISGTMIAYNLLKTQPKARLMMLEAREICSGATGRNGGHTKAASYRSYMQHVDELGKDEALKIARLEYDNIIETHRLAEELRIDCENKLCGTVDIIYDKATFELGKASIQRLRADAMEEERGEGRMAWYKIRESVDDIRECFGICAKNENPIIKDGEMVEGAFEYVAGRVHAYRFTTAVLAECVKKGLQICTNTPVHKITPSRDQNDLIWEILTQKNTFVARNLILATNGYTPFLEHTLQGAIVPMRGQITAQKPGGNAKLSAQLQKTFSFIYRDGYEYMIPRLLPEGGQHIVIGGGLGRLQDAGASEFGTVDDSSLSASISKYLYKTLPGYFGSENWGETNDQESSERVAQEWTGIMGATADGRPFVGKVLEVMKNQSACETEDIVPIRNLWISAGFNGHGMVLCLKSAEALVRMIDNGGEYTDELDWFPESFLFSKQRLQKCQFKGRTDMLSKD